MSKFSRAVVVCLVGLGTFGSAAVAKDLVVYRVVEDLETPAYPTSRSEALVDDLKAQIEGRERAAVRELGRIDGVQPVSAMTYGGGKNRYKIDDPEVFTKSLGEQRVVPESSGWGQWVARKLGMASSPNDSLPTFEEHLSGVAKVESSFIAPKGEAPRTFNGKPVVQSADRVALVVHAEADGKSYESRPIHITVEELSDLAKDPEAALKTPLGALIRSVYRQQIVGEGSEDHTGIEPLIAVQAVTGPGKPSTLLGTLPESLLDRTRKHPSLSADEVNSQLYDRNRRQFNRERIEAVMKPTRDRDRAATEAALKDRPKPPASGRGNPATIHDKVFSTISSSGRQYDIHQLNDGNGGWMLVATPPGGTPNLGSPSYQASRHGSQAPSTTPTTTSTEGAGGKIDGLLGD